MSYKVLKKFFVVKCEYVFDQTQHVDGRVGKILKPVLAPTRYDKPFTSSSTAPMRDVTAFMCVRKSVAQSL